MSSQSLLKTVHVLCLSRKSAIRLLSVSSCNTYPRTPSTAESKWGDYLNRKSNPEGSETILTTKFGGIRLDSMNTDRNEEGMTVGSLSNIAESEESTNSDFYFESETPSQSTHIMFYKERMKIWTSWCFFKIYCCSLNLFLNFLKKKTSCSLSYTQPKN